MSRQTQTSAGLLPRTERKLRRFLASRALRNKLVAFPFILFTITSCADSGPTGPGIVDPPEDIALPSSRIEVDQGSVGLVIDARAIARRGYTPATAQVDFSFSDVSVSEELVFDSLTNVAVLTLPANDLTDAESRQLNDGVNVTIRIFDELSEELTSYSDIVRVNSSNVPLLVDADLPAIYPELRFGAGVPYFAQAITDDPTAHGRTFRLFVFQVLVSHADFGYFILWPFTSSWNHRLYLHNIGPDLFRITMHPPDFNAPVYMEMMDEGGHRFLGSRWETDPARVGADRFTFALARDEDGLVRITPSNLNPLAYIDGLLKASNSPEAHLPVRVVAANIQWSVEDLGTAFSPPITPPATLRFAFRSTLMNCGPGGTLLTETVGRSETRTRSFTVGTQESLQLFSSHEASVNVTASAQAGFNLFGAGATASVETSAGYTYTTSSTSSTTNTWEQTVEESVEVSRVRVVQVPPGKAVEVYDAIQSVEDVKMPFVQKLRIRGRYDGTATAPLSGAEITSQLLANQFGGVVTRVGPQFVDVTTQGSVTIHEFFEAQSRVIEIEGACDR